LVLCITAIEPFPKIAIHPFVHLSIDDFVWLNNHVASSFVF